MILSADRIIPAIDWVPSLSRGGFLGPPGFIDIL